MAEIPHPKRRSMSLVENMFRIVGKGLNKYLKQTYLNLIWDVFHTRILPPLQPKVFDTMACLQE